MYPTRSIKVRIVKRLFIATTLLRFLKRDELLCRRSVGLRCVRTPRTGMPGFRGGGWYRCSYVSLQLIFRNGPVEGLVAALYAVLELSIPLRKLSKYFVWTRRRVPRSSALAEAHQVPGDEAMPGRFMFVQVTHCEAFSFVANRRG